MKYLATAVLTFTIISSPAMAARLTDLETGFVMTAAATMQTANLCGVEVAEGGMSRFGDTIGVDTNKILDAIIAATRAAAKMPYEHSDVIPEVTQTFWAGMIETHKEISANKSSMCARLVGMLRKINAVE